MSKKVNVCVCVKNRQAAVKASLDCLLKMKGDDYVILACDDKSTDDTINTLLDYQYANPGKVVAWQNEEEGYVNCHNFILGKTDAEYICFVDSDDFVDEKKIEEQVKFLDEHPDVDVVSSCVMFPDKKVLANSFVELKDEQITDALKKGIPMATICHFQSCMFRRKCLDDFKKGKYFYDEYNDGRCGEGFLYALHYNGHKFANIISTVYVYTKGIMQDSMTNKITPEFANTIDMIDYDTRKNVFTELMESHNAAEKKAGRPKKKK